MKENGNSRGVSDVVATILVLGLLMISASAIVAILAQVLPYGTAPNLDMRVEVGEHEGSDALVCTHIGGQPLPVNQLRAVLSTEDASYTANELETTSSNGVFGPNEKMFMTLPSGLDDDSSALASLVHKPSGTILARF